MNWIWILVTAFVYWFHWQSQTAQVNSQHVFEESHVVTPIHLLLGSVNIKCYVGAKEYMNASWTSISFFGSLNKGMKKRNAIEFRYKFLQLCFAFCQWKVIGEVETVRLPLITDAPLSFASQRNVAMGDRGSAVVVQAATQASSTPSESWATSYRVDQHGIRFDIKLGLWNHVFAL